MHHDHDSKPKFLSVASRKHCYKTNKQKFLEIFSKFFAKTNIIKLQSAHPPTFILRYERPGQIQLFPFSLTVLHFLRYFRDIFVHYYILDRQFLFLRPMLNEIVGVVRKIQHDDLLVVYNLIRCLIV